MGESDSTTPIGALVESNGYTVWTAHDIAELEKLSTTIQTMNAARAAAGLDPVNLIDDTTLAPGKLVTVRAMAKDLIDAGAIVWVIDLQEQGAMAAAFGRLPGVTEVNGKYCVVPKIGDELFVGGTSVGQTTLDAASLAAVGPDYEKRWEQLDQSQPTNHQLTAARDAIVRLMPAGPVRDALNGDLSDPAVKAAVDSLSVDSPAGLAAMALVWAIGYAQRGDLAGCATWCARVHEALPLTDGFDIITADRPDPVEVDTDQFLVVWVTDEDAICTGTVADLGNHIELASLNGGGEVKSVYVARRGQLVQAAWEVHGDGMYDDDDFSDSTVTVTAPDGTYASATWRVDGRA